MIKLNKLPKPQLLIDYDAAWTASLLAIPLNDRPARRKASGKYNHADIKATLLQETNEKCAYCESKLRHVTYGDTEHVSPKSNEPHRTFEWANLTIACDVCNTRKSDTAYGLIVDPFVDEPSEHIRFGGAMVFARPGSEKGEATDSILLLNRRELLERRTEKITYIRDSLSNIAKTQKPEIKAVLQADFDERELGQENEYSAMVNAFVDDMK